MKIAIFGDSFAVGKEGSWASQLSKQHDVCIYSQPGCSEYKIYQQVLDADLDVDTVIVSHTSWSRIPVEKHPVHTDGFHQHCDLLYADCVANGVTSATAFFENHFWERFWLDTYLLYRTQISGMLMDHCVIHLDFFDHGVGTEVIRLDLSDLPKTHPGDICHLDTTGNNIVLDQITGLINE